jgi:hypothetical protein
MVRDNRHVSTYIFGAICPERGVGAAMIMPYADTEAMNAHLKEISTEVAPGAHAILVCDGAGWHQRALVWNTHEEIVDACQSAWRFLINDPDRIRSKGIRKWIAGLVLVETRCHRDADIARKMRFSEVVATGIQHLDEHWDGRGKPARAKETQIPYNSQIALLAQVVDVFYTTSGSAATTVEARRRAGTWFNPKWVERALQPIPSFGEI